MKTDSQLQRDVMAELEWEPSIHAAQIGVEAKDGVVTLAGEVSSYAEKWNAEAAAQRVFGVKALAVELTVKLSALGTRSDADIAESVKNILGWTYPSTTEAVKVAVEGGWLTLSGNVEWQYQREDAASRVRFLPGVRGISNDIAIKPAASSTLIKSDIEAALKRCAVSDARAITVKVEDGAVTLSGTVHNWAERDLATRSAWGSAGVSNVVDKLELVY